MPTTRIKEKLSSLISTQLPEHITSEYPTFKTFLEKYYEFLEQDQGAQEVLQNARSYADIDKTIDSFIDNFLEQYTKGLPKSVIADKTLLVKYAKELHSKKGTEDAFRILFRLLFNEEIDFVYPNETIFKPSDGKWEKPYVIRASSYIGSPFDFSGTKITGANSGATAIVESVLSFASGTDTIYEIYLNPGSITGDFIAKENITGKKLNNVITGSNTITVANIYPIVTKIDIIDKGAGYILNQPIFITGSNGTGAAGIVSSLSDAGGIREIQMSSYGVNYDSKPNVTIGTPLANVSGKYRIVSNVATISLSNVHSLVVGSNINITFKDNTNSDLNGTTQTLTVDSIPNLKTFLIGNVSSIRSGVIGASNVNTSGNVSVVYTINKFITGRFALFDNTVRATLPIEHGLQTGENVNVIFNKTDVDSFSGHFRLKDYSNVTVGFSSPHSFAVGDKINVTFDSNYTNTNTGIYVIKSYPNSSLGNTANIRTDELPHKYSVGQNVNVKIGLTLTNATSGSFNTIGSVGAAYFLREHNFFENDIVNVYFTNATLRNYEDQIQIKGNANVTANSNVLVGTDTEFTSNLFVGNVISLNFSNTFTVANVASNSLIYLTTNALANVTAGNVYIVTSNLNGNATTTTVTSIPNRRVIIFSIVDKPATRGCVLVSSVLTNSLVNTYFTAVVLSNGAPDYRNIDVALPANFPNVNSRGYVTITNNDGSNIVGNTATQVTVLSVPNSKLLIFNSNVSSNLAYANGTATVTTDFPGDIEDFAKTYTVTSVPNPRTITFTTANANTKGNVTVYYSKNANLQANVGSVGIGPGVWIDDSGKLDENHKIQGRIGTDDRVYYQPFSYVIKSSQPLTAWREAVKKLLHPAGFEVFGDVVIDTNLNNLQNVTAIAKFYPIKIIGNVDASFTNIYTDTTEYTADNET